MDFLNKGHLEEPPSRGILYRFAIIQFSSVSFPRGFRWLWSFYLICVVIFFFFLVIR